MSSDKEYLLELKISLREKLKKSNLCDGKLFTREVEEKFYQIYYENK